MSGYIVETEAYRADDPASHSYRGLTDSNKPLFYSAGAVYVYFTYGMHYCLNIVTGVKGEGEAVLIRALEPVDGIALMKKRRKTQILNNLTNGPGKLAQAFGIDKSFNGTNIFDGPIFLQKGITPKEIAIDKRIGITKAVENEWRFYIKDNPFVSRVARPSR